MTENGRHRHLLIATAWILVALGVTSSWVWSLELRAADASVDAALYGAATFVLLGGGVVVLVHRSRPPRPIIRRRAAIVASTFLVASVLAFVVPLAMTATTVGNVEHSLRSTLTPADARLSPVASIISDRYGQTTMQVTVRTTDAWAPQLVGQIAFAAEEPELSCTSVRPVWIHEIGTVTLYCDRYASAATLRSVKSVTMSTP